MAEQQPHGEPAQAAPSDRAAMGRRPSDAQSTHGRWLSQAQSAEQQQTLARIIAERNRLRAQGRWHQQLNRALTRKPSRSFPATSKNSGPTCWELRAGSPRRPCPLGNATSRHSEPACRRTGIENAWPRKSVRLLDSGHLIRRLILAAVLKPKIAKRCSLHERLGTHQADLGIEALGQGEVAAGKKGLSRALRAPVPGTSPHSGSARH